MDLFLITFIDNINPLAMKHFAMLLIASLVLMFRGIAPAQQVADTSYRPVLSNPEYKKDMGPVVYIDEGHNNFHTASGRYLPFANVLRADGYRVKPFAGKFTEPMPGDLRILVIANALNQLNITSWYLPTPSAFTKAEIENLRKWVKNGGSLFLIADHMPFGGAAADLAEAFGFRFTNGFALDTVTPGPAFFSREENTLFSSPVTDGRNSGEMIDRIATFTGQAFRGPSGAVPVLAFSDKYLLLESDTAWIFGSDTRYTNIKGWLQGACMTYGKGRIVFFGEAAMFTAQLAGPDRIGVGLNSDYAGQNYRLLLNIIHWLDNR
jgi:hypothetical protein